MTRGKDIGGRRTRLRVDQLRRGDVLHPTGAEVVTGPVERLAVPSHKRELCVRYPSGRLRTVAWRAATKVAIHS